MGKFIISRRSNLEYQFNLLADNHQIILTSEGYKTKAACEKGIDSVRNNSITNSAFDRKVSNNGKPYFNLKATNGQVIGTSEMYESSASMENGIASVKRNAPEAEVAEDYVALP